MADKPTTNITVSIKPLEWRMVGSALLSARSLGLTYEIRVWETGRTAKVTATHNGIELYNGDNIDAAKSVVQTDYECSIYNAITITGSPTTVSDAAKVLLKYAPHLTAADAMMEGSDRSQLIDKYNAVDYFHAALGAFIEKENTPLEGLVDQGPDRSSAAIKVHSPDRRVLEASITASDIKQENDK